MPIFVKFSRGLDKIVVGFLSLSFALSSFASSQDRCGGVFVPTSGGPALKSVRAKLEATKGEITQGIKQVEEADVARTEEVVRQTEELKIELGKLTMPLEESLSWANRIVDDGALLSDFHRRLLLSVAAPKTFITPVGSYGETDNAATNVVQSLELMFRSSNPGDLQMRDQVSKGAVQFLEKTFRISQWSTLTEAKKGELMLAYDKVFNPYGGDVSALLPLLNTLGELWQVEGGPELFYIAFEQTSPTILQAYQITQYSHVFHVGKRRKLYKKEKAVLLKFLEEKQQNKAEMAVERKINTPTNEAPKVLFSFGLIAKELEAGLGTNLLQVPGWGKSFDSGLSSMLERLSKVRLRYDQILNQADPYFQSLIEGKTAQEKLLTHETVIRVNREQLLSVLVELQQLRLDLISLSYALDEYTSEVDDQLTSAEEDLNPTHTYFLQQKKSDFAASVPLMESAANNLQQLTQVVLSNVNNLNLFFRASHIERMQRLSNQSAGQP